jgi:hypothetical protein
MCLRKNSRSKNIREHMTRTTKEVIQMRRRTALRSWMNVILMTITVIGMVLLLSQAPAQAAVDCSNPSPTADADADGFTDAQECQGIVLRGDSSLFKGKTEGAALQLTRDQYLDPDTKDLFVILVAATPSKIPANPLEYISKPQSQGGLGIAVHIITPAQADPNRYVTPTEKAVRVTENLDVSATTPLGISSCGTPNGLDLATVYTQRIENFVRSVYSAAPQSLIDTYIKHTITHEVGHMVGPLAPKYNASYGGYHYKTGANDQIMNQSVYYKGTTFYIGTTYTTADQGGIKLK